MKRYALTTMLLAIVTSAFAAGGPAVSPAQACTGVRIDHPSDPGWATYCGLKFAICDAQADKHDTYVRYWERKWPSRGIPKESDPIPEGPIFKVKDSFLTRVDTFGRWNGRVRVPQYCSYERQPFQPAAFSVCVTGNEGCSKVRRLSY